MKLSRKTKPGFNKNDVKVIQRFLTDKFPSGGFTPQDLVKLATPQNSPIHKYFEWNNTKAAHLYRLDQARKMVQAVVVEINGIDAPAYVSIRVNQKRSYIATETARNVPDMWEQVLARAMQEAKSWAARYDKFRQLSPIIKTINKVSKELRT